MFDHAAEYGDGIEPDIDPDGAIFVNIHLGRPEEFLLFALVDPGCRVTEFVSEGILDLDKDDLLSVPADNIDFQMR